MAAIRPHQDVTDVLVLARKQQLSPVEALGIIRGRLSLSYRDLQERALDDWGIRVTRMTFVHMFAGRDGRTVDPPLEALTASMLIFSEHLGRDLELADLGFDAASLPGYRLVDAALRGYRTSGPEKGSRRRAVARQRKDTTYEKCETRVTDVALTPVGFAA